MINTKDAAWIGVHLVVYIAMISAGFVALDAIAAVSPRLEAFVIAFGAVYGLLVPMVVLAGLVFARRARRDVEAHRLARG